MTGVFVLTCPRKTEDPWQHARSVTAAVDAEQLDCPRFVVVDADEGRVAELRKILPDHWEIERYARPETGTWIGGNKWPYWRLLEVALDVVGEGGEAITLEDDVEFCTNAVTRMLTFPIPRDVDAVQFFSAWLFGIGLAEPHPGLWRTPCLVQGTQAIKFPGRSLKKLVAWGRSDEWQKFNESDVALGLAQQRLGLRIANHLPDIAQHTGHVSVVSHGMLVEGGISDDDTRDRADHSLADRTSKNFPGTAFDAMRLYARHDLYR